MELLPLGPVVIIDTPGLDDEGGLGALRVEKARQILDQIDIAVLVTDASRAAHPLEQELLRRFAEKKVPSSPATRRICSQTGRLPAKTHSTPAQ